MFVVRTRKLLSFHEDFDVVLLIHFNWGHSSSIPKLLQSWRHSVTKSYSKNATVKKKYALRYLCGQERLCRISGLAQRIAPAVLNLRGGQGFAPGIEGSPCYLQYRMEEAEHSLHSWILAILTRLMSLQKALGRYHEDMKWRRSMRREVMDHAHEILCPLFAHSRA